ATWGFALSEVTSVAWNPTPFQPAFRSTVTFVTAECAVDWLFRVTGRSRVLASWLPLQPESRLSVRKDKIARRVPPIMTSGWFGPAGFSLRPLPPTFPRPFLRIRGRGRRGDPAAWNCVGSRWRRPAGCCWRDRG